MAKKEKELWEEEPGHISGPQKSALHIMLAPFTSSTPASATLAQPRCPAVLMSSLLPEKDLASTAVASLAFYDGKQKIMYFGDY